MSFWDDIFTSNIFWLGNCLWLTVKLKLALILLLWWLANLFKLNLFFLAASLFSILSRTFPQIMSIYTYILSLIHLSLRIFIISPYFRVFFALHQSRNFLYAYTCLFNLAFHVGANFRHLTYEQVVHFLLGEIPLVHRHLDLSLTLIFRI